MPYALYDSFGERIYGSATVFRTVPEAIYYHFGHLPSEEELKWAGLTVYRCGEGAPPRFITLEKK